jgi:hypothetical protein
MVTGVTAILGIDHVQLAMPAGREDEARALVERLREARVDVVEAPTEGYFRVYVGDPFGSRIELMERVGP